MRVACLGDSASTVTYYAVVETSAQNCWVSLKPVTGRTHQLRAHGAHRSRIVGDQILQQGKLELPGGLQNRLHLLARRIVIPHPRGGVIDATAAARICCNPGTCWRRGRPVRPDRERAEESAALACACINFASAIPSIQGAQVRYRSLVSDST